ncbi:transcriptional regulator [Bradyrhizobium liaoningense]|uniref:ATP-binding protein n=1 Tax=Bradyrhizobium liaoningense TaxID=43992 RepID=UPI001BADC3C5|nr:transcriptional regulator [Bradyrhizobium liaoningense]MBR0907836.1 transcriptional regulator [Bradyrhizobium liaoningense]
MTDLSACLIADRFVTVVGPGGVGKTTVALAAARSFSAHMEIPACFVDLSSHGTPASLPSIVSLALGVPLLSHDPTSALVSFLRKSPLLLVLDNCETSIDAAAELTGRIYRDAARTYIIATSREALRAGGEQVYNLRALDCPPDRSSLSAADALSYASAELFVERATAAGFQLPLLDSDAPQLAKICRRLDGIPFALELAASRVGSLGLRNTADLLEGNFVLDWKGRRTASDRHQTIAKLLDWSYRLLTSAERTILSRASVFVDSFTSELAADIISDSNLSRQAVRDTLAGLTSKSLISISDCDGEVRYRLLEITRAYASIRLDESGDTKNVRRSHAAAFAELLESRSDACSVLETTNLESCDIYVGDVRAALKWALSESGDPELGTRLAAMAAPLLIRLLFFNECRRSCLKALALLPHKHAGERLEMRLHEALSYTSMFVKGNSEEVRASLERGLTIATNLNSGNQQLHFLAGLNTFLYRTGDFRGAIAIGMRARIAAKQGNIPAGLVAADWMLGVAYHCVGSQDAAERHCQQGFSRLVRLGVHEPHYFGYDHRVRALVGLAGILWLRGFAERAISVAEQAIREAEFRNEPISVCLSLYTVQVFLRAGLLRRAAELSERLTEYAIEYGFDPFRAVGLAFKGEIALHNGELAKGIELLRSALSSLRSEQHNILQTVFSGALAEGLQRSGRFEESQKVVDGAIALANDSGASLELAELLRIKTEVLAAIMPGNLCAAITTIRRSLEVSQEQAALAYQLRSAITFARLERQARVDHGARTILESIYRQFTEGLGGPDLQLARAILSLPMLP